MTASHYILRLFLGEREVSATTVAVVSGANSYPAVGQTIDDKWKVVELLESPKGEYHLRVESLT